MIIKRSITFSLKARSYKGIKITENLPIRMRVSYNSKRIDILTGYNIDADKWDQDAQKVRKGFYNKNKDSFSDINSFLSKAEFEMNEAFKEFEVKDYIPSPTELEDIFLKRMQKAGKSRKLSEDAGFWKIMDQFMLAESTKNSWQPSTIKKFKTLKQHIKGYRSNPKFKDFDNKGLTSFLVFLIDTEKLSNRSTLKTFGLLKWFLNWAANENYHDVLDYKTFKPRLTTTNKKVIFLTIAEIRTLINTPLPPGKEYLEKIRDVFVFLCFSGLRYSDAFNLKRSDIKNDRIEITTKKTADSISIDLNDTTRAILDKYKEIEFPFNRALPVISNQKMNDYLKDLCSIAGIDEQIRETTYRGNSRIDMVYPKYELISTHSGRRSFICNCLAQGIPVNVVMKWTGHSDYKSMRPYIDVADAIKAKEMNKLNNLL